MRLSRRDLLVSGLALGLGGGLLRSALDPALANEDLRFFRIGTGSTAGTYYPVGGLIAAAISNPPGSRDCESGGACGVPGLIAVAQATAGSVENVRGIESDLLESGFCQADVAYWAATGEAVFQESGPIEGLSVLASLFPEALHLVVRREAGIGSVEQLKGRRVSLDRKGSGTRVDALLLLEAFGLDETDVEAVNFPAGQAAEALRNGELDAFFLVAGTPAAAVSELAQQSLIHLLPLEGEAIEGLKEHYPFFSEAIIPAGTYFNVAATPTLAVQALWLAALSLDAELVYGIVRALWTPQTRKLLDAGHPRAQQIQLETALAGVAQPPLHPGAEAYYREIGLIKA